MKTKLKNLYEVSFVMICLSFVVLIISIFELVDGLSYSKIMLMLTSLIFMCFASQARLSINKSDLTEECNNMAKKTRSKRS